MPIERPYALLRHHAGWADVFHIEAETASTITGRHPDRDPGDAATYNPRAVLARFATLDAARAAREAALATWRAHDPAVREAEARLREVEQAREAAWLACLRQAEGG